MYLKKGKIIFDKTVEDLQKNNSSESIEIIIENIYNTVMANLDVNNL